MGCSGWVEFRVQGTLSGDAGHVRLSFVVHVLISYGIPSAQTQTPERIQPRVCEGRQPLQHVDSKCSNSYALTLSPLLYPKFIKFAWSPDLPGGVQAHTLRATNLQVVRR